jgi:hypothetical protein
MWLKPEIYGSQMFPFKKRQTTGTNIYSSSKRIQPGNRQKYVNPAKIQMIWRIIQLQWGCTDEQRQHAKENGSRQKGETSNQPGLK